MSDPAAAPEETEALPEQGGRPPVDRLWDDEAFRARVVELAQMRGLSPREAILGAGTSSKYMEPASGGRNTNIVMRLAKFLGVHPAYLMFGPIIATGPDAGTPPDFSNMPISTLAGASMEQRLAIISQIVAAHWLNVALDPNAARQGAEGKLRQIAAIIR